MSHFLGAVSLDAATVAQGFMPVPIYNMQGTKKLYTCKIFLNLVIPTTWKLFLGLQLPDQGTTNDPNVLAYQTNLQQAFLQSAMAQNIRIQQQLLAQNQAFQQLLLQQQISVIM